jgi:predicted permease
MILDEWLRRIWYLLNRRQLEEELRDEMEAHREAMASPGTFGNTLRLREESSDVWGWKWLDDLAHDVRYACRALRLSPGFALSASLILSVGIGGNLAAFQFLDSVLWKPLPFREPATLVRLEPTSNKGRWVLSYPAASFIEAHNDVLAEVMVQVRTDEGITWETDLANRLSSKAVSVSWFDGFGYVPVRGRLFRRGIDDAPGASPVVVLSSRFWERKLNGDTDIVGRTVRIHGRPATVVGIVPPDLVDFQNTSVWLPINQVEYFFPGSLIETSWNSGVSPAEMYTRIKSGISLSIVRDALRNPVSEIANRDPDLSKKESWLEPYAATTRFRSPDPASLLFTAMLGGLSLLILIVACANLSNVVLSRATDRVRELSIRVALGISRTRLMRHLLGDTVLVACIGMVGGLVLAYWTSRLFEVLTDSEQQVFPPFVLNWRVIVAALGVAAVSIVAVGLLPAWKIGRQDLTSAIRDGGHQTSYRLTRSRTRQFLLAVQIGSSALLLVLTGLVLHSLQKILTDRGFEYEKVAVLNAPLTRYGLKGAQARAYWLTVRDALASNPDTENISLVSPPPLTTPWVRPAQDADAPGLQISPLYVDGRFFDVMQIPVLYGRSFHPGDTVDTSVMISRRLAMRMYGRLDVVGTGYPKSAPKRTIVGVVEDARLSKNEQADGANLYQPPRDDSPLTLLARSRTTARQLIGPMKQASFGANERVAADAHPMSEDWEARLVESRLMGVLGLVLAGLALAITCIGIFGTVSYVAILRRKEIGIRMSLGANGWSIVLTLMKQFTSPLVGGVIWGMATGVLIGGLFADRPVYAHPFDPLVLATVALILIITAGLAAVFPGWRALRTDVLNTLRCD